MSAQTDNVVRKRSENQTAKNQHTSKVASSNVSREVKTIKISGSSNGHDYVDLGLPSGTLWAACNVGASSPQEIGGMYNLPFKSVGIIQTSDDPAYTTWGSNWCLPTGKQIQELIDNCKSEWKSYKGVPGRIFTGPNGNILFFPASGWQNSNETEIRERGEIGGYWAGDTSSPSTPEYRYTILFNNEKINVTEDFVSVKQSIRPVYNLGKTVSASNNTSKSQTISASNNTSKNQTINVSNAFSSQNPDISYSDGVLRVGSVFYRMIPVLGGTFMMGGNSELEKPKHKVTLTSYMIGMTEVTQALWKEVMGDNPSHFKGEKKPVGSISWNDCQTFIAKLNSLIGKNFRLPTEAEWEFAARGGSNSNNYQYSGSKNIDEVAWYLENYGNTTHDVASKKPNELGIYDMSGNVFEFCSDRFGNYSKTAQTNPTGPSSGTLRVMRGGGCRFNAEECRSTCRGSVHPDVRGADFGFRLVLSE